MPCRRNTASSPARLSASTGASAATVSEEQGPPGEKGPPAGPPLPPPTVAVGALALETEEVKAQLDSNTATDGGSADVVRLDGLGELLGELFLPSPSPLTWAYALCDTSCTVQDVAVVLKGVLAQCVESKVVRPTRPWLQMYLAPREPRPTRNPVRLTRMCVPAATNASIMQLTEVKSRDVEKRLAALVGALAENSLSPGCKGKLQRIAAGTPSPKPKTRGIMACGDAGAGLCCRCSPSVAIPALQAEDHGAAQDLHVAIIMEHAAEAGGWTVGLKRLIHAAKSVP